MASNDGPMIVAAATVALIAALLWLAPVSVAHAQSALAEAVPQVRLDVPPPADSGGASSGDASALAEKLQTRSAI